MRSSNPWLKSFARVQRLVALGLALLPVCACLSALEAPESWPCSTDDDCIGSEKCGGYECIPANACRSDEHCGKTDYCDTETLLCVERECNDDSACGRYACVGYVCATNCYGSDYRCSPGNVCDFDECLPSECTAEDTSACGGYACADGRCHTDCTNDRACAIGYTCEDGACEASGRDLPCETSADCAPPNSFCAAVGRCTIPCTERLCSEGSCTACGDGRFYCGSDGMCARACEGLQCGTHNGFSCGKCAPGDRCVANLCVTG